MGYAYLMRSHTERIQQQLQVSGIQTRPAASLGIWCAFLLPACVMVSCISSEFFMASIAVSDTYHVAVVVSQVLIMALIASVWQMVTDTKNQGLPSASNGGTVFAAVIGTAGMIVFAGKGLPFSLLIGVGSALLFPTELSRLLKSCPGSFTFGEACVVVQAGIIFVATTLTDTVAVLFTHPKWRKIWNTWSETKYITTILEAGLLGILAVIYCAVHFPQTRQTKRFYVVLLGTQLCIVYPYLWAVLGKNPAVWFLEFASRGCRPDLIALWFICTAAAVGMVVIQSGRSTSTVSTSLRKYFHLLVLLIYSPGLLLDYNTLYLASGAALAGFILVEMMRILCIPPLGESFHSTLTLFIDEKDSGPLILTHIYLLAGCSVPLWLHPDPTGGIIDSVTSEWWNQRQWPQMLPLIAGILSVGIGDAAASVGGSLIGRRKWSGTKKTVEGTVCSVAAQTAVVFVLFTMEIVPCTTKTVLYSCFAVFTSSLVEAFTDQVDNLVLPFITYLILV